MKVQHALGCATVLAAAVLTGGCDSYPPDLDLHVSLSVSPTSFRVGDSTEYVVRLDNNSTLERTVTGNTCMFGFQVYDSTCAYVGPSGLCVEMALHIAPGESIYDGGIWHARTGSENPEWLPPGRYTMVGVLDAVEVVLQSPEVSIEILPPN